jgi:hippurate hydrolase
MPIPSERLLAEAGALLPDAIALRRRIHRSPELGLHLPETTAAVLESLAGLDLEITRSEETSGIVALLRGAQPGPSILLRADMDALPMPEDTGLDFASRFPDRMHACGHDAHTAMLAAAAQLLDAHRGEIRGSVAMLFQPGEEGFFGAKRMIEEGLLDGIPHLEAVFALHVDPRLPSGHLASRPGPVLAAADAFSIDLQGRGGHASMPHDTLDPIPAACEIVLALQGLVTRRIDAFDPAVITVAVLRAGTTVNVIPESARLQGTLRSVSEVSRERARQGIHRVATQVAAAHDLTATVHVIPGYPATVNDAGIAQFARDVAVGLVGEEAVADMKAPMMGAEDFSYILERLPGAVMFLGACEEGDDSPEPCHSNRMRLDEGAMTTGIALHAAVAIRYLEEAAERGAS